MAQTSAVAMPSGAPAAGLPSPQAPERRWVLGERQPELDGLVWIGVRSTGIYCRPTCPARAPLLRNVEVLRSAAEAVQRGYRACRRCRPHEGALWGAAAAAGESLRPAYRALLHGDEVEEPPGWGEVFGVALEETSRHVRLDLALQLLLGSGLAVERIAAMVGLGSDELAHGIERATHRTPREHRDAHPANEDLGHVDVVLTYRPPFAWHRLLEFLSRRAVAPFEEVVLANDDPSGGGAWRRRSMAASTDGGSVTVQIEVRDEPGRHRLRVSIAWGGSGGPPLLLPIVGRIVDVFDLAADPAVARDALAGSELAPLLEMQPGIRVPGCWDPFEMLVRAILGQQVTVQGANTLATRLVDSFGDADGPPSAQRLRTVPVEQLAQVVGLPEARARCIRAVAEACATTVDLSARAVAARGADQLSRQLLDLRGIGPWTVDYLRLRALGDRDVLLAGDLVARRRAATVLEEPGDVVSGKALRAASRSWSPARAVAQMLLWQEVGE